MKRKEKKDWFPDTIEWSYNRQVAYEKAAKKKLMRYVIHSLNEDWYGLTVDKAIKIFARHHDLEIKGPLKDWLYQLYVSGENDCLKKQDPGFYLSYEWIILRKSVLKKYGYRCLKCGEARHICVDHIKPRSKYPELSLDLDNLQVLCRSCNSSKGDRNTEDYRNHALGVNRC
jgi:hypothetical protein